MKEGREISPPFLCLMVYFDISVEPLSLFPQSDYTTVGRFPEDFFDIDFAFLTDVCIEESARKFVFMHGYVPLSWQKNIGGHKASFFPAKTNLGRDGKLLEKNRHRVRMKPKTKYHSFRWKRVLLSEGFAEPVSFRFSRPC